MNVRRLQGLALIVSAACLLLGIFIPQTTTVFFTISTILFILGIPAIQSAQPTGSIGLAGIILLEIAALIALGFRLNMVPSSLGSSLSLTSALVGMLGAVVVGWLTTREQVFPAWLGWAFVAHGLLNFFAGQFNLLPGVLPILLAVLQAVVLSTYGYFIYQKPIKATIAREHNVPLT
jgi:hypothetical protein